MTKATGLLVQCLHEQSSEKQRDWLDAQLVELQAEPSDTNLSIALGMAPRRLGKADLQLTDALRQEANAAIPGWDLSGWSVPDAARVLFLSHAQAAADDDASAFVRRFKMLCQTADVSEAVSLYRGLPVYGHGAALEEQVAEGLRTNMKAVFEAIAHNSPYPRTVFDEHRWNHMVLKALFVDSRLAPIQGLDDRANASLARIMRDFAHERWAAGRPVPFEIWRCVGPFADADAFTDLQRALSDTDPLGRQAAALALSASTDEKAAQLLADAPDLAARICSGELSWASLG